MSDKARWRYQINYGPDGEENWAHVYDEQVGFVGNLKSYHAYAVVDGMNELADLRTQLADANQKVSVNNVFVAAAYQDEIEQLKTQLAERDAQLAALQAKIGEQEAEWYWDRNTGESHDNPHNALLEYGGVGNVVQLDENALLRTRWWVMVPSLDQNTDDVETHAFNTQAEAKAFRDTRILATRQPTQDKE
jgi:hypothetical protein